jgi:SAM-dependent methyltransferase
MSVGGEAIPESHSGMYDTLIAINVIEHVQNAFEFLTQIYTALKPGGLLIFHDRYYLNSHIMDGDLWHPVRIKRRVLDHFLAGFQILYNNCSATYGNRIGDMVRIIFLVDQCPRFNIGIYRDITL